MKKFFLILFACAVFQIAYAQETPSPDNEAGESLDFVVTAGRTRESVNTVPGQVTVITPDDIAESGATNITELLEAVPGIRLSNSKNGIGVDVSMRGISSDYGNGKVLIIVDGMRLNPTQSRVTVNWDVINLSDIERIEILEGGASVQYGDNAQVGVINIITKKSGAAKTDITVSGGSFFQNEQRFSHHRPTDWGSFTVSGGHRGTQGYQKHTANDTGNGEIRGIFDINDAMSLQANVGFSLTNGLLASQLSKAQFDEDPTQNVGPITDNVSNSEILSGLGFTWAINESLSFDLPVSYNWKNVKWDFANYSYVMYRLTQMVSVRPKMTAELKPAGMDLRLSGGVDTLLAFGENKVTPDLVKETNFIVNNLSEITIGPWALVNFRPISFLGLNAGVRYDTAFFKADVDEWSGTLGGNPVTRPAVDESKRYEAFVYEAGITVNPLDFLKVYAKYGTQFKFPYLDDYVLLNPATTHPTQSLTTTVNNNLELEKGWTAEGGIGINFKGLVKFDANFFFMRIDNEIAVYPTSPTARYSVNMDPIERLGTSIGLNLTPIKYVELDMDYGFVNAEFTEGPYEGKFVPMVAKHILSASLMLHTPFGLSLGPDVVYKSEMYQGLDNANTQPTIDSSLIWGLQARYAPPQFDGNLAVLLTVHNLADTKYASMVYYMGAFSPTQGTIYYVDPNMGRSVNVSVQYRF
ncbi:MAG: TonB-dependent receptor [Treponema sp.]|nr:TonB-dependent receptor [Treponema sp.]